jgi:catechol 2,3-dioxygenase-like lactoylglutathione lyase family enzyme
MSVLSSRTTLFCRDIEQSIYFYNELLGLSILDDKVIRGESAGSLLNLTSCDIRMVLLSDGSSPKAILGLFEISQIALPSLVLPPDTVAHGQTALVFETENFAEIYDRCIAAEVPALTTPIKYPKPVGTPGSPAGIYNEVILFDPDKHMVSLLQIDPIEQS